MEDGTKIQKIKMIKNASIQWRKESRNKFKQLVCNKYNILQYPITSNSLRLFKIWLHCNSKDINQYYF